MSSNSAYPWFFFYRIARLCLLVFLPTLFLILFLYRSSYKEGLVSQMALQIEEDLKLTDYTLRKAGMDWKDWCSELPASQTSRYTLADSRGLIICDTEKSKAGQLVNNNSEFKESFQNGFAFNVRKSDVFQAQAVFASLRITADLAIRKIVPVTSFKDNLGRFDRVLFLRIVPFAFLSYLLFIYLFYSSTKPLGLILSKVEKFKADIPFKRSLRLLYLKNEWAQIDEALNKADQRLQDQIVQVRTENEKIAAILESINDSIIAIDKYETILFYNSKFKKHFQHQRSSHELTPRIWHSFSDEHILGSFRSVLKAGKSVSLKAMNFPESHNPDRFFDLSITPLKSADGAITGALGVFYDVTEFKLTEQMRVDFVANVSHEIRTPLTSIKGFTQILQSQHEKIDSSMHLFLEKIISNTERMIALFNDLLNLSVIESQNLLKFEELDLPYTVDSVSESIMANYPGKDITIDQDLRLTTITGDQRLIEQVLSNLVDNACKYSGEKLRIRISSFESDGKAYVEVADDGPGISKEHINRIFERFYRVETSREFSRGAGLGLSIVKHIIAKHSGRIWAQNEEPSGTKFVIELPLKKVL
ncbi:MAG TPA: ATP-binding protein [Bacteriovoracaceae bacterium]|nr:ATP-binding protein [Bacteriovoracaceae bacterium]